jgi:hypothetical protein
MRILSLLEEGKITAAEAARLLEAVAAAPGAPVRAAAGAGKVQVQVIDTATGVTRVHFTVPAALARIGIRLVAAAELAEELAAAGISAADLERVQEAIDAGTAGTVLEIDDGTHGYRVDVRID